MSTAAARLGNTIDVTEIIDHSPFTPLHWRSFTLCMACLVMDGFDVQVLGYTAPSIVREWGVPAATLGPVFAAANFGVLLGALFISMLADRIGRRPVIVAAALFVGVMTMLTGRVTSVPELLLMRFLTGIGLGTIVSNASSLVGEYGSKRMRATLIMYSGVGFTGGAAFGGFVATALIPAYGWQSVFYFGGAIPLVIGLIMLVALPESLQFMALRGKNPARLAAWLNQVDPSVQATPNDTFVVREENKAGVPIRHLFRERRAVATIVFWVVNFMNLLNLYSLASWLPTVVSGAGYSAQTAVLVGTVLQVGGTLGTVGLAWLVARAGFVRILSVTFVIASISVALIGQPSVSLALLYVIVFVAGWCVVGSQPGLNALSGAYYPTYIRSTGIGAGLGVGRIGAIVGPVIGGMFIAAHWSTRDIFLAAAIPAAISAVAMFSLRFVVGTKLGRAN
ncbi:MAG TPA: MFS transporter [Vicinamibacterales bacterium]|jgi:AAHS family 4-hydroxybenzoate transporter-like MFS transporter|nr:MFS transporter [Vicinamibacterales bacterium]